MPQAYTEMRTFRIKEEATHADDDDDDDNNWL